MGEVLIQVWLKHTHTEQTSLLQICDRPLTLLHIHYRAVTDLGH